MISERLKTLREVRDAVAEIHQRWDHLETANQVLHEVLEDLDERISATYNALRDSQGGIP